MRHLVLSLALVFTIYGIGCQDDTSPDPDTTTDSTTPDDPSVSDTPAPADDTVSQEEPTFESCEEILDYCRDNDLPFPDCNVILEANGCPPIPAGGGGDGPPDQEPVEKPTVPTVCTENNSGSCECSDDVGFTTYTWWIEDQQRCFTTYVPPDIPGPLPALLSLDCYVPSELSVCNPNNAMVQAANQYGFVGLCATSPDGNWQFGNDGVANDANPTPCSEVDSKDIAYLTGIFSTLDALSTEGVVDDSSVYAWGFSQNSMFSAYTAICFPDEIQGIWQGGSGLFVAGETNPLPQMEGACRKSDFEVYGEDCVNLAPCDECQYFPAYPVSTDPPLNTCIMMYEDDYLSDTALPMYERMLNEGHNPVLLDFPAIGRGHDQPLNEWAWMVSCLNMVPKCSAACAQSFLACMEGHNGQTPNARSEDFEACYGDGDYPGLAGCNPGCAATVSMLRVVEEPCVVNGVCDGTEDSISCPLDCAP